MPRRFLEYDERFAKSFGKAVRNIREDRDISQATLADLVGVARQHISYIETGQVKVSLEVARDIAKALGVDLGELLGSGGVR